MIGEDGRAFSLTVVPGRLAICRLPAEAMPPSWSWRGTLVSVTRTLTELSIVCAEEAVPEGVLSERGWRGLSVQGPLDFALTGVLRSLLAPLADAGVPVFVISTHHTDHLLVREAQLDAAAQALRRAGHRVAGA